MKKRIFTSLGSKARLANAWFGSEEDEIIVMTKNDEFRGKKSSTRKTLCFLKGKSRSPSTGLGKDVKLVTISPQGDTYAVVRKEDEICYLEIWLGSRCVSVNVEEKTQGKNIYTDNQTGGIVWCPKGRYVAYVADTYCDDSDQSYDHVFDFGEAYEGRVASDIFVCDVEKLRNGEMDGVIEKVETLAQFVGDPQLYYDADSKLCVCYTAWKDEAKRLGLVYCPIRLSAIMTSTRVSNEKWSKPLCLSSSYRVAHTPRVSPTDCKVVFFASSNVPKTHNTIFELILCDIETRHSKVVVSKVSDTTSSSTFAGFYGSNVPKYVWLDQHHVVYTVAVRSRNRIAIVSLSDGKVQMMHPESKHLTDHVLLSVDAKNGRVLFLKSSITSRPDLMSSQRDGSTSCLFVYDKKREQYVFPPSHEKCAVETSNVEIRQISYDKKNKRSFESVLTLPRDEHGKKKYPLIVAPHGGPHSVTTLSYRTDLHFLCEVGYATLCVNYRGSIGFGLNPLESLPGRIGEQDLGDVIDAVKDVVKNCNDVIDTDRIFYAGGSHGGFLGLHFALSCNDICKAVAIRNPVTNVASMYGTSDIADWTVVEALGMSADPRALPSADEMKKMWKCSPISRPLPRAGRVPPHLFLLGQKDRRVPVSQGIHMAERLKQAGVNVRVLMYPQDNHPLSRVETQLDRWISTLDLFERVIDDDDHK